MKVQVELRSLQSRLRYEVPRQQIRLTEAMNETNVVAQ